MSNPHKFVMSHAPAKPTRGVSPLSITDYLAKHKQAVAFIMAGGTIAETCTKFSVSPPTVIRIKKFMRAVKIVLPPKRKRPKAPPRPPKPPRPRITKEQYLAKHHKVVKWLTAGKTLDEAAKRSGVSLTVASVVKHNLGLPMTRRVRRSKPEYLKHHGKIVKLLKRGKSRQDIARMACVSYSTVRDVAAVLAKVEGGKA